MRLLSFSPATGRRISAHGSAFTLIPLMGVDDTARATLLHLGPGEAVGEHEAVSRQLLCVLTGTGWVSGDDGARHALHPLEGAAWEPGERHAAGSDAGLLALSVEGDFDVAGEPIGRDRTA
jgi:hypothetical protein